MLSVDKLVIAHWVGGRRAGSDPPEWRTYSRRYVLESRNCRNMTRGRGQTGRERFMAQLGQIAGPHSLHILFTQRYNLLNIEKNYFSVAFWGPFWV